MATLTKWMIRWINSRVPGHVEARCEHLLYRIEQQPGCRRVLRPTADEPGSEICWTDVRRGVGGLLAAG